MIESFSNASESFKSKNPHLFGQAGNKNDVQANVARSTANYETLNNRKIQDSESEHHQTTALDSPNEGKTESVRRTTVSFIGFRCRPLDPDNFAGGCKDLLDGLRHAGIIPGDEPWRINFQTRQEKVSTYAEEKTVIEIETP